MEFAGQNSSPEIGGYGSDSSPKTQRTANGKEGGWSEGREQGGIRSPFGWNEVARAPDACAEARQMAFRNAVPTVPSLGVSHPLRLTLLRLLRLFGLRRF